MSIVKLISDKLNSSIENKGSGSLVVSGGSSPISIYEELSNIDLSWSKVFLTLVDDRLVEPDHKDSNQKLIHKHLIKNKAKNINFYPLTENFLSNTEFKKPFDVTLIGMGEDGHFASLFPDMINQYEAIDINASPKILITSAQGNAAGVPITIAAPNGIDVTITIRTPGVLAWSPVDDSVSNTWTPVDDSATNTWTEVDDREVA